MLPVAPGRQEYTVTKRHCRPSGTASQQRSHRRRQSQRGTISCADSHLCDAKRRLRWLKLSIPLLVLDEPGFYPLPSIATTTKSEKIGSMPPKPAIERGLGHQVVLVTIPSRPCALNLTFCFPNSDADFGLHFVTIHPSIECDGHLFDHSAWARPVNPEASALRLMDACTSSAPMLSVDCRDRDAIGSLSRRAATRWAMKARRHYCFTSLTDARVLHWAHPGKVEAPYTVCIASASNLTGLVKSSVECRRTGL